MAGNGFLISHVSLSLFHAGPGFRYEARKFRRFELLRNENRLRRIRYTISLTANQVVSGKYRNDSTTLSGEATQTSIQNQQGEQDYETII